LRQIDQQQLHGFHRLAILPPVQPLLAGVARKEGRDVLYRHLPHPHRPHRVNERLGAQHVPTQLFRRHPIAL